MSDVKTMPDDLNSMSSIELERALRNLRLNETGKQRVLEDRQTVYRNLATKRAALSDDADRRAMKNDIADAAIAITEAENDLRHHREAMNAAAQRLGEVQRQEAAEEVRVARDNDQQRHVEATFALVAAAEKLDATVGLLAEAFRGYKVAIFEFTDSLKRREPAFEVADFIGMTGLERVRVSIRERLIREGFPITLSQVDSGVPISTIAEIIQSYHLIGNTMRELKGAAE